MTVRELLRSIAALVPVEARGGLDALAADVVARRRDPYGVAEEIVMQVTGQGRPSSAS